MRKIKYTFKQVLLWEKRFTLKKKKKKDYNSLIRNFSRAWL